MPTDPITPILLLVIGILMLLIKATVIPGFGVAGVIGLLLTGAGVVVVWSVYGATLGASSLVVSALISIALVWLFFRSGASRRLIREDKILGDSSSVPSLAYLIGRSGVVTKPLRPAGTIEIDNEPYDVVSEGQFIDQGEAVVVIRISTNSLVVEKTQEGG
jgi:membrane-bound serine protease (ClpP class)